MTRNYDTVDCRTPHNELMSMEDNIQGEHLQRFGPQGVPFSERPLHTLLLMCVVQRWGESSG